MQLGESVNGLMMNRHWRFVVSDAHNVAEAVSRHDSAARLVAHDVTQQISVVRFVAKANLGDDIERLVGAPIDDRGGAYMLVFYPKGPDGQPMRGEPDMTVVTQLQERDLWARRRGQNPQAILAQMQEMDRRREAAAADLIMERTLARVEEGLFAASRAKRDGTWAPGRIYVPSGPPKAA